MKKNKTKNGTLLASQCVRGQDKSMARAHNRGRRREGRQHTKSVRVCHYYKTMERCCGCWDCFSWLSFAFDDDDNDDDDDDADDDADCFAVAAAFAVSPSSAGSHWSRVRMPSVCQQSTRPAARRANMASSCAGDGVRRRRSPPRGTW